MNPVTHLQNFFGYNTFRPQQEEIITSFSSGKDTMVLMPTGGGKSICYQIPALMMQGTLLVISPLIALMKDQVDTLNGMGIPAAFLNSSLSASEQNAITQNAESGDYQLLYIAPERLGNPLFLEWLQQKVSISGIAVDEAHCISQWGHDFRPDYRNLKLFRQHFPHLPIIALTASATPQVQKDIVELLNLNTPEVFQSSFYRKNLALHIVPKRNMLQKILNQCKKTPDDSVIIYCFSRKETEEISSFLQMEKIPAAAYHAGLSNQKRNEVQDDFLKDNIQVVCATIAFGMGIDKSNIRTVMHTSFPKTLEGYYQETGRAGRDGLSSECILMYSAGDFRKHEFFLNQSTDTEQSTRERKKLGEVMDFCEQKSCRWISIIEYFGEQPEMEQCGTCDICTAKTLEWDATIITQKILSAIIRTGSRFGKNHVLKILKGSREKKVLAFNHDTLPVYGIVDDFSLGELSEIFAHLVAKKLITKNSGEFPTFRVTEHGIQWLKNKEKIMLPEIQKDEAIISKKVGQEITFDRQVFTGLKALRKRLADERNIPPFIIFSDKSLQEMAHFLPQNKTDFEQISGVGAQKLADFGDIFVEKIIELTNRYSLTPPPRLSAPARKKSSSTGNAAKQIRMKQTQEMIFQKKPLHEIANEIGMKETTIVGYLEDLKANGESVDIAYLLPEDKKLVAKVQKAFIAQNSPALVPIFQKMQEQVPYHTLRLIRMLEDF